MNKKISSFFLKKWRVSRDRSSWIVQGFKYICFEISFLSFFFHSGIYFPFSKLHSKGFHEFCASFFGRKTADCQKLRGAKLNPRSLFSWIYITTLIHLFCKSSRDLLKISCFVEFHSPESVEVQYTSCRVSSAYSFRVLIYRSEYFSR